MSDISEQILELNDQFRRNLTGGNIVLTRGISARRDCHLIVSHVRTFDVFTESNDPHHEHDFAAFDWEGEKIFWKIDYYDVDYAMASPDPTDIAVTRRVLTIMLAEEY